MLEKGSERKEGEKTLYLTIILSPFSPLAPLPKGFPLDHPELLTNNP